MGFTDVNELLSLSGAKGLLPGAVGLLPGSATPVVAAAAQLAGALGAASTFASAAAAPSTSRFAEYSAPLPLLQDMEGSQPGSMLAIVRGSGKSKTVRYKYGYPLPGAEEVAYCRMGPFPLLWQRRSLAESTKGLTATPAMGVRKKVLSDLTGEEKRWMSYDRILHPDQYEKRGGGGGGMDDGMDEEEEELPAPGTGKGGSNAAAGGGSGAGALDLTLVGGGGGGSGAGSATKKRKRDAAASAAAAGPYGDAQLEDGVAVRFDLDAPPVAIYRALYLSVEDKDGLRGNRRDVGPQTTSILVTEGTLLMGQQAARNREDALALASVMAGGMGKNDGEEDGLTAGAHRSASGAGGAAAGTALARGLVVSLPSLDGGLGWSRSADQAALAVREITGSEVDVSATAVKSSLYASKLDRYLPPVDSTRGELQRVLSLPLSQLGPAEREIRRLFNKFHDHMVPPRSRAPRPGTRASDGATGRGTASRAGQFVGTGMGTGTPAVLKYDPATGAMLYDVKEDDSVEGMTNRAAAYTSLQRFQAVGSQFSVARSAVPIPIGAPARLRRILVQRADRLQKMWHDNSLKMGHASAVAADRPGGRITADVDERARELLTELDRANACDKPTIDCRVLHGDEQRFATPVLRDCLEMELDRVLLAQVYEREAIERALLQDAVDTMAETAARSAAMDALQLRKRGEKTLLRMAQEEEKRRSAMEAEAVSAGKKVLLTPEELADRIRRAAVADTMEKDGAGAGVASNSKLSKWKGDGFKSK